MVSHTSIQTPHPQSQFHHSISEASPRPQVNAVFSWGSGPVSTESLKFSAPRAPRSSYQGRALLSIPEQGRGEGSPGQGWPRPLLTLPDRISQPEPRAPSLCLEIHGKSSSRFPVAAPPLLNPRLIGVASLGESSKQRFFPHLPTLK